MLPLTTHVICWGKYEKYLFTNLTIYVSDLSFMLYSRRFHLNNGTQQHGWRKPGNAQRRPTQI